MQNLPTCTAITPDELPRVHRQLTACTNRQAAKLLAVSSLAKEITNFSNGTATPEKMDEIQQFAEAILYQVEDIKNDLNNIALAINDISVEQ